MLDSCGGFREQSPRRRRSGRSSSGSGRRTSASTRCESTWSRGPSARTPGRSPDHPPKLTLLRASPYSWARRRRSQRHDHRDHQPEGWGRQDHHRRSTSPPASPRRDSTTLAHRSRSAGQLDACPSSIFASLRRQHVRRAARARSSFSEVIVPADRRQSLGRPVANRHGQARGRHGG